MPVYLSSVTNSFPVSASSFVLEVEFSACGCSCRLSFQTPKPLVRYRSAVTRAGCCVTGVLLLTEIGFVVIGEHETLAGAWLELEPSFAACFQGYVV